MWPNPQFLRIWSHLLKKSLMKNFIFLCCAYQIQGWLHDWVFRYWSTKQTRVSLVSEFLGKSFTCNTCHKCRSKLANGIKCGQETKFELRKENSQNILLWHYDGNLQIHFWFIPVLSNLSPSEGRSLWNVVQFNLPIISHFLSMYDICSKLIVNTRMTSKSVQYITKRRHWCRSDVFVVNFVIMLWHQFCELM